MKIYLVVESKFYKDQSGKRIHYPVVESDINVFSSKKKAEWYFEKEREFKEVKETEVCLFPNQHFTKTTKINDYEITTIVNLYEKETLF